jgi:hypothetical protein
MVVMWQSVCKHKPMRKLVAFGKADFDEMRLPKRVVTLVLRASQHGEFVNSSTNPLSYVALSGLSRPFDSPVHGN